jgi:hypothetical protein
MKTKIIKIGKSKEKIISNSFIENNNMVDEVTIELKENYVLTKSLKKEFKKRNLEDVKKPIKIITSRESMPFGNKFDQEDWTW